MSNIDTHTHTHTHYHARQAYKTDNRHIYPLYRIGTRAHLPHDQAVKELRPVVGARRAFIGLLQYEFAQAFYSMKVYVMSA